MSLKGWSLERGLMGRRVKGMEFDMIEVRLNIGEIEEHPIGGLPIGEDVMTPPMRMLMRLEIELPSLVRMLKFSFLMINIE